MTPGNPRFAEVGECISALLREIERAQRAAVNFDIPTLEDSAREHQRLGEALREAMHRNPGARSQIHPLRPALRRYSLLLRSSERLAAVISRIVDRGVASTAFEI